MSDAADIKRALAHLGFDSVDDLHYWAKDGNELNRFDALVAQFKDHRENEAARIQNEDGLHIEFGKELAFAALGLKSQEAGTVAKFSIEIDGMKRDVAVTISEEDKDMTEKIDIARRLRVGDLCYLELAPKAADYIEALERAERALRGVLPYVMNKYLECNGDKCRHLTCGSCFGEEYAVIESDKADIALANAQAALSAIKGDKS